MDTVFCTLFDSNYLDKGLVLYDSMREHMQHFKLYVFAFDEKCYEILKAEENESLIPIRLSELEEAYPCLKIAKKDRNTVEYNWTCSSWSIKYVLEYRHEEICTYVDADMRFFSSPEFVFEKMRKEKNSVMIVPHRFHSDAFEKKEGPKTGYYCVEFNTFIKDEHGTEALNWWAEQCCKWCHYTIPSVDQWYGDQKYLNVFPEKFHGVYVCDHYGVGLGPWNDNRMELEHKDGKGIWLVDKKSKQVYPLVIYHFAGVRFLNERWIRVSSRMTSKKLHQAVFDPYIHEILKKREYIQQVYGWEITKARKVPAKNPFMQIYQQYLFPIVKLRHLYNLYKV